MRRTFMKVGAARINDRIHRVEFEFPDDGDGCTLRRAIAEDDQVRNICPWSFKDALSLVDSGNWAEVARREDGTWYAPTPAELERIAKNRTSDPDAPATIVELVW
jgi:hypothetical protein